jgi:hypothetical protein
MVERAQEALDLANLSLTARPRVVRARCFVVHQVIASTVFERRTPVWSLRPAPRDAASDRDLSLPDPWAFPLNAATDGRESHVKHTLPDEARVGRCPRCAALGHARCEMCQGEGTLRSRDLSRPDVSFTHAHDVTGRCSHCHGTGEAPCRACDGSGRVVATPVIVVETGTLKSVRTVDNGSLPDDLVVQTAGVELAGRVVHCEQGAELGTRAGAWRGPGHDGGDRHDGGLYRGVAPRVSPAVEAAIDALFSEDGVGGSHRIRDRVLEVREVPLYEAELDTGHTAYVCGDPAIVLPEGVIEHKGGVLGALRSLFR